MTITISDTSLFQTYTIAINKTNILIDGDKVGLSASHCAIGIFSHKLTTSGDGVDQSRTWFLGINQFSDYYLVFDNSKGYNKRMGISRKNQFNSVIKGSWDIAWFDPWPLYNQTVIIFGIGIILILLTDCYCINICFKKYKIVRYE